MSAAPPVKRPVVARSPRQKSIAAPAVALGILGAAVFFWLSEARAANEEAGSGLPTLSAAPAEPAPVELVSAQPAPAPAQSSGYFNPNSGPVTLMPSPPPTGSLPPPFPVLPQTPPATAVPPVNDGAARLRAPALVVDLAQAEPPRAPGTGASSGAAGTGTAGAASPGAPAADRNLSDTERFSARVGSEEVEAARARQMTGLDRLVPQGAIVGAVMETALNSDLPGYARAITTRDVYSFDGSSVLIPAGSRLIGQYKSGVAQGASRVFVVWTRLIRPDGVSVELASPAVDELGRGGLGGKVNTHFFQRFGGAILTSVLTGALNIGAAALSGGSTVIVGTAGQASSLAGQAAQNSEIPPTITTRQGAPVRIFVARDLDFSQVGPVR